MILREKWVLISLSNLQLKLLQNQGKLQILKKIFEILMLHALYVPYRHKVLDRTLLCFISMAA